MEKVNDLQIMTVDGSGWPNYEIHRSITVDQAMVIIRRYLEQHDAVEISWTKIQGAGPLRG